MTTDQLVVVPRELAIDDLRRVGSWSPGMYRRVDIPTASKSRLGDLLDPARPFDKGEEPGSRSYMRSSSHYLLRTRSLRAHSYLLYPQGEGVVPIHAGVFVDPELRDEDLLLSKDSNVGECAMVEGDLYKRYMPSGGLVRLRLGQIDRYYLFAFIKHPMFKAQLLSKIPRGATIKHAGTHWMDCDIPFPVGSESGSAISSVSALMHAIVNKERAIRARHRTIMARIDAELNDNQNGRAFTYSEPSVEELRRTTRMDTGLYVRPFGEFKHLVECYEGGATTLGALGVGSRRGPNLAVSVIGKSLYGKEPYPGWHQLIRPAAITDYGTLAEIEYLGTPKSLPLVEVGDMVFGSEATWRSMVVCEAITECTTNFHGTVLSWPDGTLDDIVWLRCLLEYMRGLGVLELVAVGGQGGHLSPEYFESIPIPNFPASSRSEIARLYQSDAPQPTTSPTLDSFVAWHSAWDSQLGVWELDRERRVLERRLAVLQDKIIHGDEVTGLTSP